MAFWPLASPGTDYIAPAGERFVVDEINIGGTETTTGVLLVVDVALYSGSHYYYILPPLTGYAGGATFSAVTPVHAISDAGFAIYGEVHSTSGNNTVIMNLTGHLIDCGSGCATQ